MIDQTPTEKPRTESTVPWRWMLFGLALIALLAFLTFVAMDNPDVVWEDGQAQCPHCRSEVQTYGTTCAKCRKSFDWIPNDVPCELCFSASDVARIRAARARVAEEGGADPDGARARFLRWAEGIEAGECVACGGTGLDLLQPAGSDPVPCPVCDRDGDCVLCNGDELVREGDLRAHQDLAAHIRNLRFLAGRLGSTPGDKKVAAYREALSDLRGCREMESVGLPDGTSVIDFARARARSFLSRFPPAPVD